MQLSFSLNRKLVIPITAAFLLLLVLLVPGKAHADANTMTGFERQIVETAFQLLPENHPFVLAYESTYHVDIQTFSTEINGVTVSGVPFQFGGKGDFVGFNPNWWKPTGDGRYPASGLDCAEYMIWIYRQLGYVLPDSSSGLFLSGKTGVWRKLPGIRGHLVIPSFEEAMIGDICYNSQNYGYHSGHGSHTQMFLGTANKLGITAALQAYYPAFPGDAYLVLDCGWSDGARYYRLMRKAKIRNARSDLCGVGVQFFTTIRNGGKVIYQSPEEAYTYEGDYKYTITSRLEKNRRYLQYKPKSTVEYTMNISRPIIRPDVAYVPPVTPTPVPTPTPEATPAPAA